MALRLHIDTQLRKCQTRWMISLPELGLQLHQCFVLVALQFLYCIVYWPLRRFDLRRSLSILFSVVPFRESPGNCSFVDSAFDVGFRIEVDVWILIFRSGSTDGGRDTIPIRGAGGIYCTHKVPPSPFNSSSSSRIEDGEKGGSLPLLFHPSHHRISDPCLVLAHRTSWARPNHVRTVPKPQSFPIAMASVDGWLDA